LRRVALVARHKDAYLVLADGTSFKGKAFGHYSSQITTSGEVVFNTAMSGYQEILTDPSYSGQLVCMTYPLIGNYGINREDMESRHVFLKGLIIKDLSRVVSNYRAELSLGEYLKQQRVPGIYDIDTRALTLKLRSGGALQGAIINNLRAKASLVHSLKQQSMKGSDLVKEVAITKAKVWNNRGRYRIIVLDTGIKYNILRRLEALGAKLIILPPTASFSEIINHHPDGIFLANGPGDPAAVKYVVATIKEVIAAGVPLFGICLGHQLLAQALGAKTYKLKFGHHGANHPVKNLATGSVEITSQNHGFAVKASSLPKGVQLTHINLNDQTCEGLAAPKQRCFSVQYHPEAAPGPHDSSYLFEQFIELINQAKNYAQA